MNTYAMLIAGSLALAAGPVRAGCVNYELLVERAVSENTPDAHEAMIALRNTGPAGLEALLQRHRDSIDAYRAWLRAPAHETPDPFWARLNRALDTVGGQRDNWAAGLYWYTDLEQAKDAARSGGKPILSLRLLGRLDEDLSCANSRFLRTAIYANAEISQTLRDGFVLHWESVRPVPRITIDFGNGRKIVRTITGNNLHYVLDDQGRPLDALPGLCGPGAFGEWLQQSTNLHTQITRFESEYRRLRLGRYHDRRFRSIVLDWQRAFNTTGDPELAQLMRMPTALEAAPVSITKAGVEIPTLKAMAPVADGLQDATTDEQWHAIAALYADGARLDESSRVLMAAKDAACGPSMVERFETSLALDTVRNQFLYHREIHAWFANGEVGELTALTGRIYDELFLTPDDDPWLGLLPADTYAALDHGGVE